MRCGELNRQITIQKRQIAHDAGGYESETWVTHSERWASVITAGGGEFFAAQRINAETTAVFKIRYLSSINTGMRIKMGNRIFNILFLNDVNGQRKELSIAAKEVV